MRCPVLIGRDELAGQLAAAIGGLRAQGDGQALVLTGEAGIGKSRLALRLAELAAQAGLPSAAGRGEPGGAGGTLGPVTELLSALTRDLPVPSDAGLAPYLAVLAALLPAWRAPDWPGWSGQAEPVVVTAEAVLRVLRWAGDGSGLVLIFEDLHWADDATLQVVRYLADHVAEIPAVLLATVRTGEGRDGIVATLAAAGATVHPVGRLTADQARAMALACAGPRSGLADAVAIGVIETAAQAAEGLPLLVEDLLATGDLAGLPAVPAVPARFAGTVLARLARTDERARRVFAAAALLGRWFDWRLLPAATGLATDAVAAALHQGTALQLIVADGAGFAFRHALTREIVLAEIAPADRQRLCLAVADALDQAGRQELAQADVARSLLTARLLADGGEPARAVRLLLEAGRDALGGGDFGSAEQLLREAGETSGVLAGGLGGLAQAVAAQLAEVLLAAGQPAEAASMAQQALAGADGHDREIAVRMRLLLARTAAMTGRWDAALTRLAEIRHGAVDDELAAEVAVIQAQVALGDGQAGSRAGAEHLAARAVGIAGAAGRADLTCEALQTLASCARLRDLRAAATAYERALAEARAAGLGVQRLRILNELGTVEMLMDARGERLVQARAEALRSGAVGLAAGIGVNIAALHAMTARYDEAVSEAAAIARDAQRLGLTPLYGAALLMQGFAMAHQGQVAQMNRYLDAAEAACPDDPDLRAGAWGIGRGLCALLSEDRAGARAAFARARQEAPDQHARILNPYEGPELLLRAVEGEAAPAEIAATAAGIVAGARWPELWHRAAQAVVSGSSGDPDGAEAALAGALDAASRYPVFAAIVRRLVAEAAIRDGWGTAEQLLHAAEATFTGLRLSRAAAACRAQLKAAGHPAPRRRAADAGLPAALVTAGVTAREAEVLDLVGERMSNREIAERLFLSPRTVEKHVAALLVKLGAASRAELAARGKALR